MSAKMGKKETAKKPSSTRRHDSPADGASGREQGADLRTEPDTNRKISGQRSKQHSKSKGK